MRTALAITLTLTIGAQAQTRADRSHRADLHRPPAKCALKHRHSVRRGNSRYATPSPASAFKRVMRRGSATTTVEAMNPMQG
jgi:hypothetical protein